MSGGRPGALPRVLTAVDRGPFHATFQETFDIPATIRGRGGDLDAQKWGIARLTPNGIGSDPDNHIRHATIPTNNRASFSGGTSVYPPDDLLICDSTSVLPGTLMAGIVQQNYGYLGLMARQPFDFANRQGVIYADVDAFTEGDLATWVQIDITDEPVPACAFQITDNHETGPIAKNGIFLSFFNIVGGSSHVGIGAVHVYTNFSKAQITADFELTGTSMPTSQQDKLNRIEVRVSATMLEVAMSDFSSDGVTFPNMQIIWRGTITAPFSRGYVHWGMRNHATVKFGYAATHVYHWDNLKFDGPTIAGPLRIYEIPDNTTTGTSSDNTELDYPYSYMRLSYELSDGSGRAAGIWNPSTNISPFSIASVNLSGATSATLTLNWFVQSITHTPDTTWGLTYQWNSGTVRTRSLTSAEVTSLTTNVGSGGYLALAIPLTFADLTSGTNTLDFSTVNVPMDYAPQVQNIDLLLFA
jgi:hypothetical protein